MQIKIPTPVKKIIRQLQSRGFEAYLVGGCVRDALGGKTPHDFDMTTNALPDEMLDVFSGFTVIVTGIQHGTVTVLSDHFPVEVTTYRLDGVYSDHRHPDEVAYTSDLMEDLSRRDFTVNAMAYHPEEGLIDAFGGTEDLENGIIRCVGEPEKRFEEDALRIVRAMRFASVLDFTIEEKTSEAIHALHRTLRFVSVERIYTELTKLLSGPAAGRILYDFCDVMPSAVRAFEGIPLSSVQEAARRISCSDADTAVRYTLLFAPLEEAGISAKDVFLSLHADHTMIRDTQMLLRHINVPLPRNEVALIRLLQSLETPENFERFLMLCEAIVREKDDKDTLLQLQDLKKKAHHLFSEGVCLSVRDLAVNGNDLMKKGFSGKAVGEALRTLLDAVTEKRVSNETNALLAFLDTIPFKEV